MEYVEQLINLGLNEKEAKVYLALLSMEKDTAYSIAIKSGLKKPTTYVILEDLVKKGFVLKIPQKKKSLYFAKPPQECVAIFQQRVNEVKEILPELLAIQKKDGEKVNVSYFDGPEGVKEVYKDTLKHEGEFVAFGSENMVNVLGNEWMDNFIKERVKRKISVRAIVPQTEYYEKNLSEKNEEQLREMKITDAKEFPFSIEIDVYGKSKVSLISAKESMAAIIDSTEVHKTMKSIFELLWKKLSENNKLDSGSLPEADPPLAESPE